MRNEMPPMPPENESYHTQHPEESPGYSYTLKQRYEKIIGSYQEGNLSQEDILGIAEYVLHGGKINTDKGEENWKERTMMEEVRNKLALQNKKEESKNTYGKNSEDEILQSLAA